MKRLCWAGLLAVAFLGRAWGSAFDDFSQGVAAANRGDNDGAISSLSRALSASDILPSLEPVALTIRGEAYRRKKRYTEAVADFDAAVKLKPDDINAHRYRAEAAFSSGDDRAAAADCDALVKMPLLSANVYWECGRIRWELADYAKAGTELETALQKNPVDAYKVLWLELSWLHANSPNEERFREYSRSLDFDRWPAPIVDLYLGKESLEHVAAESAQGDDQTQRNQKCEVGFYGGEWQLMHGNQSTALALLQQAVAVCPESYIELAPAKTELKRLSQRAIP